MENTAGFYKKTNEDEWYYDPNYVHNQNYKLEKDGNRESVDDWTWYDETPEEYVEWMESKLNY